MTKLLIADDHPIVLDGIEALLHGPEFDIVARCTTGNEVLAALLKTTPDILILDVSMPEPDGIEILRRLESEDWCAKVILLTASLEDADAVEAIGLGIGGIVLKDSAPHRLVEVVREV